VAADACAPPQGAATAVAWQTFVQRVYWPRPGFLWRPGDGIGGVVQVVDGARPLAKTGPQLVQR
jgi:hypothetical protein